MSHRNPPLPLRATGTWVFTAILSGLLVACSGPSVEPPPPVTPSPIEAEPDTTPDAAPESVEPARESAPTTAEPSSRERMASRQEPALESMHPATPGAKMSVPVDLRYRITGDTAQGQALTLHLAAVPRVPLANLKVSLGSAPGLQSAGPAITVRKADASRAYRQELSVIRQPDGPPHVQVLVTADLGEGIAFGVFTIPLAPANSTDGPVSDKAAPDKPESVKQR